MLFTFKAILLAWLILFGPGIGVAGLRPYDSGNLSLLAISIPLSYVNAKVEYKDSFYREINESPTLVGAPCPRCPENIHAFWQSWINQGWFDWEQEGYPFWGNMHHTQTWWNYRHLDNIQFFHYADMLADPKGEIAQMAKFLEIEVTDEILAAIVQRTSFTAMRQRRKEAGTSEIFKDVANTFFFKGTNGRWREVLSEDELAMYETTKSQVLSTECSRWLEEGRVALV